MSDEVQRVDRRDRSSATVDLFTTDDGEDWDLDQLVAGDVRRSTAQRSRPTSCARTVGRLDARGPRRRLHRGRAGGVRGEGGAARRGARMRELERFVILQVVDTRWREHLETWTISARACTCARWRRRTRSSSTRPRATDVRGARPRRSARRSSSRSSTRSSRPRRRPTQLHAGGSTATNGGLATSTSRSPAPTRSRAAPRPAARPATVGGAGSPRPQQRRSSPSSEKLGRNDPCWCGSGKKFKKCHGVDTWEAGFRRERHFLSWARPPLRAELSPRQSHVLRGSWTRVAKASAECGRRIALHGRRTAAAAARRAAEGDRGPARLGP